jgi:hypothetical protein
MRGAKMNVDELWKLASWVDVQVMARRIPEFYSALATILEGNTQPGQHRQPFENERVQLTRALESVDLWSLTSEQLQYLDRFNIASHLGVQGAKNIEEILSRNALDIATAASKIKEVSEALAAGVRQFRRVKDSLEKFVDSEITTVKEDEVLLRVAFRSEAAINNVVDLRRWADSWHTIGRGIAMAHGMAPENIRVVGASTGSIIIELAVVFGIAKTASVVILECLNVADRVLEILKKAQEIKALRLSNNRIEQEISAEAQKEREEGAAAITLKIAGLLELNPGDEGDKVVALKSSIKALIEFITKGGQVDCILPPDTESDDPPADSSQEARRELQEAFSRIRELDARQRLLENTVNGIDQRQ